MPRRRWLAAALAGVAAALLAGRGLAGLYADWQWFAALGAADTWRTAFRETVAVRLVAFGLAGAFAAANFAVVRQSIVSLVLPRRLGNLEIGEEVSSRSLALAVAALSLVTGGLLALAAPSWHRVAMARHAVPFGETDPYLGTDLSFFVFGLPLEADAYAWAVLAVFTVTTAVVVLYALTPGLRWERSRLRMSGWVRRHLTVLVAVVMALLAWGIRLDALSLPVGGSGPDGLFTAADHRLLIPGNLLLAVVALAGAVVVLWAGWTGQARAAFAAVSMILVVALGVRGVLPAIGPRLVGAPDPAAREAPYYETRDVYTRRAFHLEAIGGPDTVTLPRTADDAVRRLDAWDAAAIRRGLERNARGGRVVGEPGWMARDGTASSVVLVDDGRPDAAPAPWIALGVATDRPVDALGALVADERPVAPQLVHDDARGVRIVPDPERRLGAPRIGGFTDRVLHAWALQDVRLAARPPADPSAVLVRHRDVRVRVGRLFPVFTQGRRVVPLVVGDSVWWALELYAASASYPLSRPVATTAGPVRYWRHAGTALVNGTTGRVRVFVRDGADPTMRTWRRLSQALLEPRDRLPDAIARLLPPLEDDLLVRGAAFAAAGTRAVRAGPGWRLAPIDGADTLVTDGAPAGWRDADGASLAAAVVDVTDTLRAVVVAEGGGRPTLAVRLVERGPLWSDVLDRLAPTARPELDGRTVAGRLRIVPLRDGGLLLAQPRYAWPLAGPPRLAGLVASDGRTPPRFLGLDALSGNGDGGLAPLDAAARARLGPLYDRMREALRRGDFAAFGRRLDSLGRALGRVPSPATVP